MQASLHSSPGGSLLCGTAILLCLQYIPARLQVHPIRGAQAPSCGNSRQGDRSNLPDDVLVPVPRPLQDHVHFGPNGRPRRHGRGEVPVLRPR